MNGRLPVHFLFVIEGIKTFFLKQQASYEILTNLLKNLQNPDVVNVQNISLQLYYTYLIHFSDDFRCYNYF